MTPRLELADLVRPRQGLVEHAGEDGAGACGPDVGGSAAVLGLGPAEDVHVVAGVEPSRRSGLVRRRSRRRQRRRPAAGDARRDQGASAESDRQQQQPSQGPPR